MGNVGGALFGGAGERVGLVDLGGEGVRQFSYGSLDRWAGAVAGALTALGLGVGARVAIVSGNRAEVLLVVLGVMRAGMVAVPVNARLGAEGVAGVLADCGAGVVFADLGGRGLVPGVFEVVGVEGLEGFAGGFLEEGFATVGREAGDAALMLYTSGSTGRAKGVVLSHGGLGWVLGMRGGMGGERVLVAAPLCHMNGLAMAQATLADGGVLVLMPGFTAEGFAAAARAWRVTILATVPPMVAMLLRRPEVLGGLGEVRTVRMGSGPVTQALLDRARAAFPGAAVVNVYGTTEVGPVVFGGRAGEVAPGASVGWVREGVEVRLVRGGVEVADEGELLVRSPGVMVGYHGVEEGLVDGFVAGGFVATGDVFRRDGVGAFHFVGRVDDMMVCGGENVHPGAVEAVLERHPAVLQACVVGVPDAIKGEKPVAFVVLRAGGVVDEAGLRAHALRHGPAYAHPRRVWAVDALPLTGTNKVDRRALRDRVMQDA